MKWPLMRDHQTAVGGGGGGDPDPKRPGKGDTGLSDNELAQNE